MNIWILDYDLGTVIKNTSSRSQYHPRLRPDFLFPADFGFPGFRGLPIQASWLLANPRHNTHQHQPFPTCPLWTGQPGAASGTRARTGDRGWHCFRASSRFKSWASFRERGSIEVKLRNRVRLWCRGMYGFWVWTSRWSSTFPGSWNPKEAVPPGTTDTSGLTDTSETQLWPRRELRKRWKGKERRMEGGTQRDNAERLMSYPAMSTFIHSTEIKRNLPYPPLKPFRSPITVSFHLWPLKKRRTAWRDNGWGLRKGFKPLSVSLPSLPRDTSGAFWALQPYNL